MNEDPDEFPLDFGSGYKGKWIGWYPDRDLNPQYENWPDLEKACLLLLCPHGQAGVVDVHPPEYNEIFSHEPWKVISWEPLHLEPSILRTECGCHGWIRDGKWVQA